MRSEIKLALKKVPGLMPIVAMGRSGHSAIRQFLARMRMLAVALDPHARARSAVWQLIFDVHEGINLPTKDFLARLEEGKSKFAKTIGPDLALKLQIVKALNLLANKHEYFRFSVRKVGRPSGFMLDTANACQLGCATCQHSFNKDWTAKTFVSLPVGTMKSDTFDNFIHAVGPYSYAGHFYNNSEPFLNKRTPQYLRLANLYHIKTMISSNMSIPKLDAEAIVESGLDLLMTAIDGTTQEVYEKYRRGGHLDLVFENVRAIVAAKRRLNSPTPRLRWQFLTFEHNVHQVPEAIEMARELGFDSFNVATPYDVSADDSSIHVAVHPKAGTDEVFTSESPTRWNQDLRPIAELIERAFDENLVARYEYVAEYTRSNHPAQGHCDWLHLGTILDALGRVHPCCLPDYKDHGSFVFGSLQKDGADFFNSEKYLQARLLFADEKAYQTQKLEAREKRSKCENCSVRPLPQIGLGAIYDYFQTPGIDPERAYLNDPGIREILVGWSKHDRVFDVR